MMPPRPGPLRQRPTARQLAIRRAAALAVLLGAAAVVAALVAWATGTFDAGKQAAKPVTNPLGLQKPFRIVFPEGFTRQEMAERIVAVDQIAHQKRGVTPVLSRKQYLALTKSSALPSTYAHDKKRRSLEGFLFPATYDFTARTTSSDLVANQLVAFRKNWKKLNLRYSKSKNLTPFDVLTIAAMVERETLAPDERPLVAAVIYNRLHAHMPLGIDATLRYGLHIPATKSIRQSDLDSNNPYNTRKFPGLPPGPIGNPGLASMQAAAHPARVKYLYFVRKPDRVHHFFTASAAEFNAYATAHGFTPH
ncbi:MAG: hypothetical protein QOE36_560 [Gaiellaceae bacterium]|nr:hypothetical protein [Gaiellaceae bacterium]